MTDTNLTRRSMAKGVAWALPAVSIAASAPSLAASDSSSIPGGGDGGDPAPPVVDEATSFAEKCQGQSQVPGGWPKQGYRLVLTTSADAPAPIISSVVLGNGKEAEVLPIGPTAIGPGAWEYVIKAKSSPSSLTVVYTINGGSTRTATISASPHCVG